MSRDSHPILPLCDFLRQRKPLEFWDWFSAKENELSEYHRSQKPTASYDEMWRILRHPSGNKFWYEARPLANCAKAGLLGDDILINLTINCEKHDAVTIQEGVDKPYLIQLTTTADGQAEKMSYLHRRTYGRSPAFQKVRYEGTQNTGYQISDFYGPDNTELIAASLDEISDALWMKISMQIRKKSKKNYPNINCLIVDFEDSLTFKSEDKMAEKLYGRMEGDILDNAPFERIILAGSAGRILVDVNKQNRSQNLVIVSP